MIDRTGAPFSVTYLPLLIRLRCCETAHLPSYLGSTLHGVMGWALEPQKNTYQYIFENRRLGGAYDVVNPYIIVPPSPQSIYWEGDELRFQFILIGDAIRYKNEVIQALVEKGKLELGAGRRSFELMEILQEKSLNSIWKLGQLNLENAIAEKVMPGTDEAISHCSIQLVTPLRIRRNGSLLTRIDFPTVIRNITRRMTLLTQRYGGYVNDDEIKYLCELAHSVQQTSSGLYVNEMNRYSSRRGEEMDLSGLLGAMTFEGDIAPFKPWLDGAQILNMGRNVTFGCGRIHVVF